MTIKDILGKTSGQVQFVSKGWGYEKILVNNELYCGKLLHFVADKKCSVHYHLNKHETFYLASGQIDVYYYDDLEAAKQILEHPQKYISLHHMMERVPLTQGQTFVVPPGRIHQMVASVDSQLYEFSTHDEPSDSYRLIKGD